MYATSHEIRSTPAQQAAYDAKSHHFRVNYEHQWNNGFGTGGFYYGLNHAAPTLDDKFDILMRATAMTAASLQVNDARFDPATLVVTITDVIPVDRHNTRGQ